uniref:Retrotransposon gag domain-containing protein n=1 Tax=Cajanus cajan TaxID=3821 RepID=A0A151UHW0_CAJCA
MKVEQLFTYCHNVSEERRVHMATVSFQGYAMYWWTSLERERRTHNKPPIQYWNELRSALRRRHIPPYFDRELMDKLQRLQLEEYRQQMELLMMRAGIREEEKTTIARKTIPDGVTNKIRLVHLGKKHTLTPLTPSLVLEDQIFMKKKFEEEKKS